MTTTANPWALGELHERNHIPLSKCPFDPATIAYQRYMGGRRNAAQKRQEHQVCDITLDAVQIPLRLDSHRRS